MTQTLKHTLSRSKSTDMFERHVLGNGLRVLTCPMPHTRSVTLLILVGAGSRYESDEDAGAFHFIEHLLFKGSKKRPSTTEVSGAIEGVGGFINASTDREMTAFICKVARPHFNLALDVLVDMIRTPLFDPKEVEKERKVILEELALSNDHPDYRVDLLIDEILWPNQPMGRDVGGTKESVSGLTRNTLIKLMKTQYSPSNSVVCVAGDITHEEVLEQVNRYLGEWSPRKPLPYFAVKENGRESHKLKLEQRQTDQAYLCLACRGLSVSHPDRYALDLLGVILGEGMSSRLFLELRERQALVYDVHSAVNHFTDCGSVGFYLGTEPKKAEKALDTILGELGAVQEKKVPQEELYKAKELAKGRILLRMEDNRSVAFWVGVQELLQGRVLTVDEAVNEVEQITSKDIQRVAQQLFSPEKFYLAAVGPYKSDRRFRRFARISRPTLAQSKGHPGLRSAQV